MILKKMMLLFNLTNLFLLARMFIGDWQTGENLRGNVSKNKKKRKGED